MRIVTRHFAKLKEECGQLLVSQQWHIISVLVKNIGTALNQKANAARSYSKLKSLLDMDNSMEHTTREMPQQEATKNEFKDYSIRMRIDSRNHPVNRTITEESDCIPQEPVISIPTPSKGFTNLFYRQTDEENCCESELNEGCNRKLPRKFKHRSLTLYNVP
eukprot:TRINITY_DN3441_c0_g2_i10.p1 TRINITY_DN3441_c0_g2~~TRINITY_DN3441_c0_g2_i10.p1  ORF type:complete len:162 (+),score=33.93 TRINITY_DN3441_c0_g2_i10:1345-1830(+)